MRLAVCFGLLTAASALCAGQVLSAPVTPEERTQCLALGMIFTEIATEEAEVLQIFHDTVDNPTVEDQRTLDDLEKLQKDTEEVGSILSRLYGDAPAPTEDQLAVLRNAKMDTLADQIGPCVPE